VPAGATEAAEERFFTPAMGVAFGLYALFALTFSAFQIRGDGLVYFNLLRRFFGEQPDFAFAYQFGSDVWNAPFFLVGKLFASVFGAKPTIFHVSFEEISITLAANAAFVATIYLGWRILRELDLPRGPAVLFLTAFGTPLFFYVVFEPGAKHAADTLYLTAATFVLLRATSRLERSDAVWLGVLAALSINTRWGVNAAFFAAIAVAAALAGRWRDLATGAVVAFLLGTIVFALPAARGIPYYIPKINPEPGATYIAAGHGSVVGGVVAFGAADLGEHAAIPFKMLFSEHRGIFLWTPLTALAAVGFGLAVREATRTGQRRGFYLTLLAGGVAILVTHVTWSKWDGGFAFSQRFLTALFPIFLIGVAELVRRTRGWIYPALALTVAWAIAIAFVHNIGYDGVSERDGIGRVVQAGWDNRHNLRHKVRIDAEDRWKYLWGLLRGYDSKHLNE